MYDRKVKQIYHPLAVQAADLFNSGKLRRVVAYVRVSTASDEQLNSVEAQKDYFGKLILASGLDFCGCVCRRMYHWHLHQSPGGIQPDGHRCPGW